MRYAALLGLLLAALVAGCSGPDAFDAGGDGTRAGAAVPVASPESGGGPETTVGVSPTVAGPGRASAASFVARARAEGGAGFDADTVLAVRHGSHAGYERLVLDLGTGERPAGAVPLWRLSSPKGDGLLRITLPSVSATGVSDGGFDTGLLESFHVARAPEGGMFVDVFARKAFLYRITELEDPARLAVDLKPTGETLRRPLPAAGGDTVLVEPRPGSGISDPLTVSGYSRNFESANTIVLAGANGEVLVRKTVAGNDWISTWGYFETTIDLPPFTGKGTLRVGTASARDGSFSGVEVPVRGRK